MSDRFDRRRIGCGMAAWPFRERCSYLNLDLAVSNWVYVALFINGTACAHQPAMNAIITIWC
jgi:hypothetical protein